MGLNKAYSYFLFIALFVPSLAATKQLKPAIIPKECRSWFERSKISPGKNCPMDCALIESDLGTFDCSRFCDDLCGSQTKKVTANFGFQLSSLYPGLTDAEKRFVDKNPQEALHAYWLSWRAESVCKSIYLVSNTNDESDACRHFMWAALLNVKFGSKLTSEILDAHEQNPDELEEEKSMDLANNRRGLIASSELIKDKKIQETDFLNQFLEDVKSGKIVTIKKGNK